MPGQCADGRTDDPRVVAALDRVADALRRRHRAGPPGSTAVRVRRPHGRFCRAVADRFDTAPSRVCTGEVDRIYRRFARETLEHHAAAAGAGIRIRPWPRAGQPYRDSRELISRVRATGELFVYLTSSGHGDSGGGPPVGEHPLRAPSGVVVDGVELAVNDVLRATHDLIGHVLTGHGFGITGELAAARAHGLCYSPVARRALFTEQVAQICWYFHGPHRTGAEPSGVRPYPDQKVFLYPHAVLREFDDLFTEEE